MQARTSTGQPAADVGLDGAHATDLDHHDPQQVRLGRPLAASDAGAHRNLCSRLMSPMGPAGFVGDRDRATGRLPPYPVAPPATAPRAEPARRRGAAGGVGGRDVAGQADSPVPPSREA